MPESNKYLLIKKAIEGRHPLLIHFDRYLRAVCPQAIGTKDGMPVVLAYQYGGGSAQGVITADRGIWLCMPLVAITGIEFQQDVWRSGDPQDRPAGWATVVLDEARAED